MGWGGGNATLRNSAATYKRHLKLIVRGGKSFFCLIEMRGARLFDAASAAAAKENQSSAPRGRDERGKNETHAGALIWEKEESRKRMGGGGQSLMIKTDDVSERMP